MELLRNCILFREMLLAFTRRELRQRYVGSIIGWPWPFLQPMMMLGVYYFVFSFLMGIKPGAGMMTTLNEVYSLPVDSNMGSHLQIALLCAGLLPWLMTAEYVSRSANVVIESGNLVKKVAFPSELLPISILTAYVINTTAIFAVFCAIVWIFTPFVSPWIFMFPVIMFFHALFLLGLAYLLGTINVFVRDVGQMLPLLVNLWFFLTPIIYLKDTIIDGPAIRILWVFDLNPMSLLMDLYRWCLFYPSELHFRVVAEDGHAVRVPLEFSDVLSHLAIFAGVASVTFVVGYRVFMSQKMKFADEI